MATLEPNKIKELDLASARVASGGAMGAVKDATGKVINAGDQANIDHAIDNFGYKYTPPAGNAALADAVQGAGQSGTQTTEMVNLVNNTGTKVSVSKADWDNNPAYKNGVWKLDTGSDTNWMEDWMKSAFGNGETEQVKAPTFDVEKARLETAKTSRIAALDTQYATDLAKLQKNNKNLGSSLKARLMKLGVSPSDSAWSNAEAGQAMRDAEAESALRSEYLSNKAKIEADLDSQISTLAMNEATMKFNATIKNIENKLQTQAQGINLYQIFSQRDQSEKDREQRAYAALQDYEAKMATLDQAQQEAISKNLIDNAQKGLYNISDKNTLEMLANLEKQSPYLIGLTNIATAGLSDRLDKKAQAAADLAKTNLDMDKTRADIGRINAATQKIINDGKNAGLNNSETENYIASLGQYFMPNKDGKVTLNNEVFGSDGKMDSSKYSMELNKFISTVDPKLKNPSYYKKIYYTQFPPQTLLNTNNDPTAANVIRDYETTLRNVDKGTSTIEDLTASLNALAGGGDGN